MYIHHFPALAQQSNCVPFLSLELLRLDKLLSLEVLLTCNACSRSAESLWSLNKIWTEDVSSEVSADVIAVLLLTLMFTTPTLDVPVPPIMYH